MSLAIFDLDLTLIGGDSDYQWNEFLIEKNAVDPQLYQQKFTQFHEDYENGTLDLDEYFAFSLHFLTQHPQEKLLQWRGEYIETKIKPLVLDKSKEIVEQHRNKGDELIIITATNYFITQPIAELFAIEHLIAPMPEVVDNHYTGKVAGIPSFGEGKVIRLLEWMKQHPHDLANAFFYTDSRNDLPLLEKVGHPIAVNPDSYLKQEAQKRGWEILNTLPK